MTHMSVFRSPLLRGFSPFEERVLDRISKTSTESCPPWRRERQLAKYRRGMGRGELPLSLDCHLPVSVQFNHICVSAKSVTGHRPKAFTGQAKRTVGEISVKIRGRDYMSRSNNSVGGKPLSASTNHAKQQHAKTGRLRP